MKSSMLSFFLIVSFALPLLADEPETVDDADLIPPDILIQMDPGIFSGELPRIITIQRKDIFGLRPKPQLEADLVQFDFEPDKLSTAHKRILDAWMKAGHHKVCLLDDDITKYASLFGYTAADFKKYTEITEEKIAECCAGSLKEHPVNVDCDLAYFGTRDEEEYNSYKGKYFCNVFYYFIKDIDTEKSEVVVEGKEGEAVCGSFSHGDGTIYFMNSVRGPDTRRWYLNFMHWALDRKVPGAAKTEPGGD